MDEALEAHEGRATARGPDIIITTAIIMLVTYTTIITMIIVYLFAATRLPFSEQHSFYEGSVARTQSV